MNSITCGPRPAVSYFQMVGENIIIYMGRNLLLNSINRGLAIRLYRKKSGFYRPNSCTFFNSILSSTVTSTNFQLVKKNQVTRNLASCDIATSLGTFPIMLFGINIQISNYIYVYCLQNILHKVHPINSTAPLCLT